MHLNKLIALISLQAITLLAAPAPQFAARNTPNAQVQPNVGNLSFEPIGPGDLLFIYVADSVDNTRSVRVQADGTISMPSLKDPIKVTGLLATDVERVVADALIKNKIFVDPAVSVEVTEYRSKPVNVVGEVKQPLAIQAIGNMHLLDAIAKADGLTSDAGSQIIVSGPGTNGAADWVQIIPVTALMTRSDPSLNILLQGGEEIRVPPAGKFFVVGNVKSPGAYAITEGEKTTVLKALALCQGTLSFSQPEAFVYRTNPLMPGRQEIPVPLKLIMKRQAVDFDLEPNDVLYVPDKPGSRMTATILDRLAGFGSSTTAGILVYKNK